MELNDMEIAQSLVDEGIMSAEEAEAELLGEY